MEVISMRWNATDIKTSVCIKCIDGENKLHKKSRNDPLRKTTIQWCARCNENTEHEEPDKPAKT